MAIGFFYCLEKIVRLAATYLCMDGQYKILLCRTIKGAVMMALFAHFVYPSHLYIFLITMKAFYYLFLCPFSMNFQCTVCLLLHIDCWLTVRLMAVLVCVLCLPLPYLAASFWFLRNFFLLLVITVMRPVVPLHNNQHMYYNYSRNSIWNECNIILNTF